MRKVNLQKIFKHPSGWIESIIPHPTEISLFSTIYSNPAESRKAVLWRMPTEEEAKLEDQEEEKETLHSQPQLDLEKVVEIPSEYSIRNIIWEEEEEQQVTFEGYGSETPAETEEQQTQPK